MSFSRSKEISTRPYRLFAPLSLCLLLLTACDEPIALELTIDDLNSDDPIIVVPINDTPVADDPIIDIPINDTPIEEDPIIDIPINDTPVADDPIIDIPINDTPIEEDPIIDIPINDTPIEDDPIIDTPINDTPIVDDPIIDTPINDTPIVDDPIIDVPINDSLTLDESILERFFFKSVAEIDSYFHQRHIWGHLPEVYNQEFYGSGFAFKIKSWLSFYIDMHKNTGDQKWIDYAETTIEYMFSRTDNKLLARNELTQLPYYQAPQAVMKAAPQTGHIGWSIEHPEGRLVLLLQDGVICKYTMKVVDYVSQNNIDFDNYKLNSWIDTCTAIIKSHDSEFVLDRFAGDSSRAIVDGSYYYTARHNPDALYSNPLGFNHSANAASAMYLINKYRTEPEFTIKQHAIADFIMRNFTEVGDHYSWPYGIKSTGVPFAAVFEDVNHSTYNASFLYDMYNDGYIDESFMERFLRTVPVFLTETTTAHDIAGGGTDDGGDRTSMYEGYLAAAKQLNPEVYNLILTNLIDYSGKTEGSFWHAQLAAAARVANLINLQ